MERGDPFRLIDVLTRHEVSFVIIGGHAVTFHGFVRATEDTDIIIRRSPECDERLVAALTELNAQWIGDEIDPTTGIEQTHPVTPNYVRGTRLMMLITDLGFLDIFDFVPGLPDADVDQVFDSSIANGGRLFVALDWLRSMKRASGRPSDQHDLENLPPE